MNVIPRLDTSRLEVQFRFAPSKRSGGVDPTLFGKIVLNDIQFYKS